MDIIEFAKYLKEKMKYLNDKIESIESCADFCAANAGDFIMELSMKMLEFSFDIIDKGRKYSLKYDSFHEHLKKILKYYENFLDQYDPEKQKMMIFDYSRRLKIQQMELKDWKTVNVVFKDWKGQETNLTVETKLTFKELFDKYMNKAFGHENSDIFFVSEHYIIKREDNTKIKSYYYKYIGKPSLPTIMVLNSKSMINNSIL